MNIQSSLTSIHKRLLQYWVYFVYMITVLLCITSITGGHAYTTTDLPIDHSFQPMIGHLVDIQAMYPLQDGSFGSHMAISRASAITAVMRSAGYWPGDDYDPSYLPSDTDPNQWYSAYVAKARQLGFIAWDQPFRPTETITKAEALKMMTRALNIDYYKYSEYTRGIAKDVPADVWYAGEFAFAKKYRIAHLHGGQYFYPEKLLTRGEFAVFLYRTLRVVQADDARLDELELEAQMQHFIALVDEGKIEAAQEYIPRILSLSEDLVVNRSDTDSLAAHTMSLALDDFARALRAYNNGDRLTTVEYLHTASLKLTRVESTGQDMAPLALQFNGVIEDMIASLYIGNGNMVATQ